MDVDLWYLRGIIALACALWCWVGYEYAMFKMRGRGQEVDRDVHPWDLLPIPPAPVVVPDHVPEDWSVKA